VGFRVSYRNGFPNYLSRRAAHYHNPIMSRPFNPSRNWSLTCFTDDYEMTIASMYHTLTESRDHDVGQVILNVETCPTTQRIHLQGALWFKKAMRCAAIVNLFPELDGAHFEITLSSEATARYCRKNETQIDHFEWTAEGFSVRGNGTLKGPSAAERLVERCMELIGEGITWPRICKELSTTQPLPYMRNAKNLEALYRAQTAIPKELVNVVLRPWQRDLITRLDSAAPDGRTIHWVYDAAGNNGKSWLCNYLIRNRAAIMVDGRTQDMAYAYSGQPIVCIDIARGQAENMDHLHVFAEKVASGNVFSSKYESVNKVFDNPPHVIIFANVRHNAALWTAGRCVEVDISLPAVPVGNVPFF